MYLIDAKELLGWRKRIGAAIAPAGDQLAVYGGAPEAWLLALRGDSIDQRRVLAHHRAVIAAAFRHDGEWLATGGDDQGVWLWRVRPQAQRVAKGHLHEVSALAWSATGDHLASASHDGSVRLWSMRGDEAIEVRRVRGLGGKPLALRWSERRLFVGTTAGLRVYDATLTTLLARDDEAGRIETLVDGATCVVGLGGGVMTVWDRATMARRWQAPGACAVVRADEVIAGDGRRVVARNAASAAETLIGEHDAVVRQVVLAGERVVSGGADATLRAWGGAAEEGVAGEGAAAGTLRLPHVVIGLEAAGRRVVATCMDGTIAITSIDELEASPVAAAAARRAPLAPIASVDLDATASDVAWSADGERVAVAAGGRLSVRDPRGGAELARLGGDEELWGLEWTSHLISSRRRDCDGFVLFDAATLAPRGVIEVNALTLRTHAERWLIGSGYGVLVVHDVADPTRRVLARRMDYRDDHVVSPDGRLLFAGACHGAAAELVELPRRETIAYIGGGQQGGLATVADDDDGDEDPRDLEPGGSEASDEPEPSEESGAAGAYVPVAASGVFSPDGTLLLTKGEQAVSLWRVPSGEAVTHLRVDTAWILGWSPRGDRFVFSLSDDSATLCDREGKVLARWAQATMPQFSPDGAIVACGARSGPAHLFDARTGAPIAELGGHATDHLGATWVSPDRVVTRAFVKPTGDPVVKLWDRTGALVAALAGHHGDSFRTVVASPRGDYLATAMDGDLAPRLWRLSDGACLATLDGHAETNRAIVWAPDRDPAAPQRLATLDDGGGLRVWEVPTTPSPG